MQAGRRAPRVRFEGQCRLTLWRGAACWGREQAGCLLGTLTAKGRGRRGGLHRPPLVGAGRGDG